MNVLSIKEMIQFKKDHDNALMDIPGVIGCGVGVKNYIDKQITTPCINLYVEKWTPEIYNIHKTGTVFGVPVKVEMTGPFEFL